LTEEGTPSAYEREWDASTYDRIADPMTRWGEKVLGRLDLTGGELVLDAGCGSGRVTEMLLDRLPNGRVVALDASAAMLEEARRRLERFSDRVSFVQCDLLALGPSALGGVVAVDAVLSTATFHWVLDHERLFANIASVLRPGGQLVSQSGAEGNIDRLIETVRSIGDERRGTWLYPSVEETRSRLERAGFEDIEVWTNPEPTRIEPVEELETYLETVCLRTHVATLAPQDRRPYVAAVAAAMPEPVIDYVRLNIVARRS